MKYDQLTKEAQAKAITEVSELNPMRGRDTTLDELLPLYEYNSSGEIKDDPNAGLDPEYYEDILN